MSETGSESPKKASDDEHLLASSDAPSIIAPFNEPSHVVEEKVPTTNEPKTDGDGDVKAKTTLSTTEINRSSNSNESEAEEKSKISKCSLNDVAETEEPNLKEESTLVLVKNDLDESSTICNDLVNSARDNQQQKEKDENNDDGEGDESAGDEDEQVELLLETPDEGSCSRSRPYTRQSHKFHLKEVTCEKMPTPPLDEDRGADEDEDLNDSRKIICHITNPLESLKKDPTLNSRVPVSEIPPTESSDQKSDIGVSESEKLSRLSGSSSGSDSSSESETSSKPVSTNKVVAPTKIGQQRSHSPPSSNNSISCGVGLVNFPGSNHDHKDKRLAISPSPVTKNVPASGQLHHHQQQQHQGTTTSTKKGSKIPVGIAVAWQRLVTSNSSLHNSSSSVSTMSCAPSHKVVEIHKHHKEKVQLHSTGGKIPVRPSSASPVHVNVHATSQHHAGRDASGHKIREFDAHTNKSGSYSISRRSVVDVGGPMGDASVRGAIMETNSKSVTPELTTTAASCRPLPSSSVPPNLGLSYFHQQSTPSLLDYHYGSMRSLTPFPPPHPSTQPHNLFHSLPPTWQASTQHHHLGLGMDLNVPQGFPSAGAYIQQTMQNQLQFQQHLVQQYSNYGGGSSASSPLTNHPHHYLPHSSVGYENTLRQHYEQLLQQQQQSEYFRHHFHQQQQSHLGHQLLLSSAGMYNTVNEGLRIHPTIFPPITTTRIPLLSPSSTGGVRTPTPTNSGFNPSQSSHSLSLCNLSAIGPAAGQPQTTTTTTATVASPPLSASSWSAELFHHNSSTALSPKSLTSSSPSPVTVQQTYKEQGSLTINTIAGGGSGGCSENTVTTFVGRNKCATPTTSPNLNKKNTFPRIRESPLSAEALQDQQKQHLSTSSTDKDLVDGRLDETREELDHHTDKEIHHGRLNKHSSAPKTSTSSSEYNPSRNKPPSAHVQYEGKREGNKRDLDESPQHTHPTTKTEGQITKHDFKRLDSLIEKRNSEAKSDEEGEVHERDHDDDENLMVIKSGHEMTSTPTSKSVMMGEGMHPNKVFTPVKADLKQNIVPLSLGNSSGTDLNQNLKMVSPPQISTLPVSKVKAVTPLTKKAKPKVKVSKGDDDGYDGTSKKPTSKAKKPAAPKEKVSLQPKENKIKEKPPRNNLRKTKSQVADLGESGPVGKARKPCKIKPDMNTAKSKDNNTTTSSSNSEPLQLKKQPKQPKVYKSKKVKDQDEGRNSRRLFSPSTSYCDSLQNVRESNGNNVPETNLPVAVTSGKVVTDLSNPLSSNSDIHTFPKNDAMLGLSPGGITTTPTLTFGTGRGAVVPQVASSTGEKKGSRSKNSTPMLKNVKDGSNKSPKRKNSDPKQPRKVKSEIKSGNKKEKANVVKRERRKPVAIKSKGTELVTSSPCSSTTTSSAATTTVILTSPTHPTLSFPGGSGGPIGMNPAVMTFSNNSAPSISSGGESCSVVQSSPIIPISLPYHNSPVTLILPRLLPQTTITNSHQQTSFKLVVSSQEIKIPAFVPTQPGGLATIEGTSQVQTFHLHHREQNYQNHIASSSFTSFHNQSMMRSAVTTSSTLSGASGPLFLTTNASSPCDTVSNSDNTITFIRDSPMSPPHQNHNGIFEGIVRNPNLLQQQQTLNPTLQSCYLSPPMTNQVRKEFIQPEDSHLNLLATVAQEFGSRDDLGKLASHSNSSRGSSLMTSPILPVQSPELNYFPTPSSTISSSASTGSNNTAVTSISLPSSPLNAKFISKSPHRDEYEYDEKEDHGNSAASPGSYKHPVWLKIPTIVPTAAKMTTSKKRKQRSSNAASGNTTASQDGSGHKKPPKKQKEKKEKFDSTGVNSSNKNARHPQPKVKSSAVAANSVKSENSATTAHKLKIPKIALEKPKLVKERQLSPTKKAKEDAKKIKQESLSNEDNTDLGGAVSMKIKLPVPAVAKIRIKLSETENPTLMGGKMLTNGKSKQEIKKQKHIGTEGGGDSKPVTLSRKRKQSTGPQVEKRSKNPIIPPGPGFTTTSTDSGQFHKNDPLKLKRSKPKNYHQNRDNTAAPKEKGKRNSKNKPISVKSATLFDSPIKEESKSTFSSSLSPKDSLVASSSFASLTPPPTANNSNKSATGAVVTSLSSSFSPKTSSFSLFSPPSFERQPQTSNNNNGGSGDTSAATFTSNKPISWVSDPTFAASAIRMYGTSDNPTVKSEKVLPLSALSSDEDEDQILMEYERRTAEKMRNEDKTIIPNIFNSTRLGGAGEAQDGKAAFVPYTSPNKRALKHQQHHIKPCLKAEPRPRSGSSEDENSDAEVDFEVASLTNSIPRAHTSMLQHYRNTNKLAETSSSVNKSVNNVAKNSTETISAQKRDKKRRRLSSTASSKKKKPTVVGRRLSLNLETGRTHEEQREESEEELLDIGGDYDNHRNLSTNPKHHHRRHHHHRRRQSASSTKSKQSAASNENKLSRNANKYRRFSGGSTSTSASFGSTMPKKLPKKRGSRSLTTSSRSSVSSVVVGGGVGASTTMSRSRSGGRRESIAVVTDVHMEETLLPGKIELSTVAELKNEMRILTEIQGLFYTGKLNALQPPDVYGVTLDNERGAPPHLIFPAQEVLLKCVREKKPQTLSVGLRICAYWSPQYSGLYPGRVSTDFNPGFDPEKDLIPIEFDDGDTGMIKLAEIRLLPAQHPIREYDPNPLLTLEKKHRKRRHSSGVCTGDHEEPDCGESYCAKIAKMDDEAKAQEDEEDDDDTGASHRPYKSLYWTWTGLGYKRSKAKKSRNKEFFKGIQRGDNEVINVGESAIFISHGNERPYIGRIEKFWEKKGQKIVNVRWFYHPEEVKSPKRIPHLKHTGALFESPHIDENDVQTIKKKCDVIPYSEFKERIGRLPKLSIKNSPKSLKPKDLYYVAGYYDPYNYNLQMKI